MDENNITYYIGLFIAIVIGFIVVKKVASCIIRLIIGIILLAAVAYGLFLM